MIPSGAPVSGNGVGLIVDVVELVVVVVEATTTVIVVECAEETDADEVETTLTR